MKPVPFAHGAPMLGKLPEFRHDQLAFLTSLAREYGAIVNFRFLYINAFLVSSPEYIHQILVEQADKFEKANLDHKIFDVFIGSGLVNSEGDFHRRQRRLVQPAFHSKRINAYAEVMVNYAEQMVEEWRGQSQIDIHEAMSTLTRRIVLKTLFDTDESPETEQIANSVETLNHLSEDSYKRGFTFPNWLPVPAVRKSREAVAEVDKLILGIIEQRRKSGGDQGDLLSMLLLAQDEDDGGQMTDRQVRDEAVTLFLAGHETTANTLAWTFYLLAKHPEVEVKLVEELDRVLAGRKPTLQDLGQLTYTDWVIKEAMRLYPPAWVLNARAPQVDVEIDGYTIPKGSNIFISPYVMHHDPRYFTDPESFKPERWANDFEKSLPRYAYFPFGGGPRVCIGNSFAIMEARLILANIAQQVEMTVTDTVVPEPLITLRPCGEIRATIKPRVKATLAV